MGHKCKKKMTADSSRFVCSIVEVNSSDWGLLPSETRQVQLGSHLLAPPTSRGSLQQRNCSSGILD